MPHALPHWTSPLRPWQEEAFQLISSHPTANFLAVATPGAGKTRLALRVAHDGLTSGRAHRIVVVCPTTHLREQWAKAAHLEGLHLDPASSNQQEREATDFHGLATTYQQVCLEPQRYRAQSLRSKTLVIFDEIHHAGEGKEWGEALQVAFHSAVQRLLLSGTPFRTDDSPIPYVRYDKDRRSIADFQYGYPEALRDSVCRPVIFPSYEGELAWTSRGETVHATFKDGVKKPWRRERLRTALLQESWLGEVIQDANDRLTTVRTAGHDNAGGLIVAMTQSHARDIAALVQRLTGERAQVAVSDDPTANRTIQRFARGRHRWLVAVNMVSEGVDIPRLRVGVYATNVLTEMYFRQVVGRFVRVNEDGGQDGKSYLYISQDPTIVSFAKQITKERSHALKEQSSLFDLPPLAPSNRKESQEDDFEPLGGVAHADEWIGGAFFLTHPEVPESQQNFFRPPPPTTEVEAKESVAVVAPEPELTLYEQKNALRDRHKQLVSQLTRRDRLDHWQVNAALKDATGTAINQATVSQLKKRLQLLERWVEHGFKKGRRKT
ncbi:DEAD/DEAH box helicase [Nitrospira sp. M1]